jgi:hypothetical protein
MLRHRSNIFSHESKSRTSLRTTSLAAPHIRRTVVAHRLFEAPHNATTIRDRFSIPEANTGRTTWAVMQRETGCSIGDSARRSVLRFRSRSLRDVVPRSSLVGSKIEVGRARDSHGGSGTHHRKFVAHGEPDDVMMDLVPPLETVIDELIPDAARRASSKCHRSHHNAVYAKWCRLCAAVAGCPTSRGNRSAPRLEGLRTR